jgi:hypothetical protein
MLAICGLLSASSMIFLGKNGLMLVSILYDMYVYIV